MKILKASEQHLKPWLYLRKQLWPDSDEIHLQEMQVILSSQTAIAFLMFTPDEEPIGFIEGAIYLNDSQNYGYVEGWFVVPAFRRQGLGGQLLGALEEWLLHHAIYLSHSDTIPEEYPVSLSAHLKHGYQKWSTLQIFVRQLDEPRPLIPPQAKPRKEFLADWYEAVSTLASELEARGISPDDIIADFERERRRQRSCVPPIEDDLPLALQAEFRGMEMLSDENLWSIAESQMNEDKVRVYDSLLELRQMDNLTTESQILLDSLREEADYLMLRKSHAHILLKNRGYTIP